MKLINFFIYNNLVSIKIEKIIFCVHVKKNVNCDTIYSTKL
jgi:hypothetical protein